MPTCACVLYDCGGGYKAICALILCSQKSELNPKKGKFHCMLNLPYF